MTYKSRLLRGSPLGLGRHSGRILFDVRGATVSGECGEEQIEYTSERLATVLLSLINNMDAKSVAMSFVRFFFIYTIASSRVQSKHKNTHLISYFVQIPLTNLYAKPCLKSRDRKLSARNMPHRRRGRSGPDSFSGTRRDYVTSPRQIE